MIKAYRRDEKYFDFLLERAAYNSGEVRSSDPKASGDLLFLESSSRGGDDENVSVLGRHDRGSVGGPSGSDPSGCPVGTRPPRGSEGSSGVRPFGLSGRHEAS